MQTAAGAAALLAMRQKALAFYRSSARPLWGTHYGELAGGISVAAPDVFPAPVTGVTHYSMNIGQFMDDIGGGGSTTLWGFHPANPLGGGDQDRSTSAASLLRRGASRSRSPSGTNCRSTTFPCGYHYPGRKPSEEPHCSPHSWGVRPWISDGGPFDWWAPDGTHGESFLNNLVLAPEAADDEAEYYYPNDQSARLLWYHDHAWGITRINAYAGVATAYVIRDAFEKNLVLTAGLPDYVEAGGLELPIVVQDKIFVDASTIANTDPVWTTLPVQQTTGSLWYAHTYDPLIWTLQKKSCPPTDPSAVAEFFGDTMLANGTVYPQIDVEPRRYRLRILNACNARFLNLQLYVDDGTPNGITLDPKTGVPLNKPFRNPAAPSPAGTASPCFLVLGNEAGFLPNAVRVPSNVPFNLAAMGGSLILGPAERSDVVVDFSQQANQKLILYTDAPSPFPFGSPIFDHFPGWNIKGNPGNALTPAAPAPTPVSSCGSMLGRLPASQTHRSRSHLAQTSRRATIRCWCRSAQPFFRREFS